MATKRLRVESFIADILAMISFSIGVSLLNMLTHRDEVNRWRDNFENVLDYQKLLNLHAFAAANGYLRALRNLSPNEVTPIDREIQFQLQGYVRQRLEENMPILTPNTTTTNAYPKHRYNTQVNEAALEIAKKKSNQQPKQVPPSVVHRKQAATSVINSDQDANAGGGRRKKGNPMKIIG